MIKSFFCLKESFIVAHTVEASVTGVPDVLLAHILSQKDLRMVYEAEMDTQEVATALGIPEGTVRSRLHYAKKQLLRAWERETEE